ncbi:Inner membrane protein yebS [Raoultella ornithinolytica]|nr:Inner membrane protein yebS [Raoultella ornithinolytica]
MRSAVRSLRHIITAARSVTFFFVCPVLKRYQSAWCPRCNAKVRDGRDWSLSRLGSMAITMMLLMPFAWTEPLLRLHLLGVRIDANVIQGIWQMNRSGRSAYWPRWCCFVRLAHRRCWSSRSPISWLGERSGDEFTPGAADAGKTQRVGDAGYLSGRYRRGLHQSTGLRLPAAGRRACGLYLAHPAQHSDDHSYER